MRIYDLYPVHQSLSTPYLSTRLADRKKLKRNGKKEFKNFLFTQISPTLSASTIIFSFPGQTIHQNPLKLEQYIDQGLQNSGVINFERIEKHNEREKDREMKRARNGEWHSEQPQARYWRCS